MTDVTERLTVAIADRYRIERELGQGGMATVYLAEDLKHGRKVALKVLRPELAAVLGAERFVQEIRTTASLQHPHILPLYDSGRTGTDGSGQGQTEFVYYVMPYVQGETLRDKLDRETQLGIDEAVKITCEVADALHYAHEQGVIHRDIKPENILLQNGRALVADFGIALAVSAAAGGRMTETGLSLGTPHYMSPEQATAEKDLTARSDVYSLGSVLYEMLTGNPPHVGASAQQIIMKIVTEEAAPVTKLRKSVPANVAAATAQALEKLPADRFATAREFAEALSSPAFRTAVTGAGAAPKPAGSGRRTAVVAVVAALGGVLGHALLTGGRAAAPVVHAAIALDSAVGFVGPAVNAGRPTATELALSPDGRTLVFAARAEGGPRRLFARPLAAASAAPIAGTDGARAPVFSPSGDEVAFWASGHLLRVPLSGGTPVEIAAVSDYQGASWGDDGFIVFRDGERTGLARVQASGGGEVESIPSDPAASLPQVLPGSRAVVYTVMYNSGAELENRRLEAVRIGGTRIDTLIDNASDARYVTSGHLLFARAGALMAVAFDPARLQVTGSAVGVLSDVMHAMNGWNTAVWTNAAQYAISKAGHLAFLEGGVTPTQQTEPVLVSRSGAVTPVDVASRWYLAARFAPTGDRLALATAGSPGGVWTVDLRRDQAARRIASGPIPGLTWTPDGREIAYFALARGTYRVPADASSAAELVDTGDGWPAQMSADGQTLILTDGRRLLGKTRESAEPRVLLEEPGGVTYPALSPDGRWLAYVTGDASELVVRDWPGLERRTVIAGPGVSAPAWARGGRELFYEQAGSAAQGSALVLAVRSFDPATGRSPGMLTTIPLPPRYRQMGPVRAYDVAPDGQRVVAIVTTAGVTALPRQIGIILNWASTLEESPE